MFKELFKAKSRKWQVVGKVADAMEDDGKTVKHIEVAPDGGVHIHAVTNAKAVDGGDGGGGGRGR